MAYLQLDKLEEVQKKFPAVHNVLQDYRKTVLGEDIDQARGSCEKLSSFAVFCFFLT